MIPFPSIYAIAHQREDEVRATANKEHHVAPLLPRRWWRLATRQRKAADHCLPAPIYSNQCANEQTA